MTLSNNQSFTDCYWVQDDPSQIWDNIKLYNKEFSIEVSEAALHGTTTLSSQPVKTCEHNLKGLRAKCFLRKDNKLYLCKKMPKQNVLAELRASRILDRTSIPHAVYTAQKSDNKYYITCKLFTDEEHELLHYRTLMRIFNESTMGINTKAFQYFYELDEIATLQMILLDILTVNIDRNRDNFGLLTYGGKILGHAHLFDHDACFQANLQGHYFVTNMSFVDSLKWTASQPKFKNALAAFHILEQESYEQVNKLLPNSGHVIYQLSQEFGFTSYLFFSQIIKERLQS